MAELPTRTVELDAEELELVQKHREEKAMTHAQHTISLEILKVAAEFAEWVKEYGPTDYSNFSSNEGFDYKMDGDVVTAAEFIGCDSTHIYKAACRLIEQADELFESIKIAVIVQGKEEALENAVPINLTAWTGMGTGIDE